MIKTIYYRGNVDFCNYACSYCPFAKNKCEQEKLEKDRLQLEKLYTSIKSGKEKIDLMITPYGEAFYHPVYQREIIRLLTLKNVNKLGIQTNFSLDLESFLAHASQEKADLDKLMVWATCHGEFTTLEDFATKVNQGSKAFNISAGAVATPHNYSDLIKLRQLLNPEIYLWLNAMDRQKHRFTDAYINQLSLIDPQFDYEFSKFRQSLEDSAVFKVCHSYENTYIDRGRESSNCFFKLKRPISHHCHDHNQCDCYLGYSNFKASKLVNFFGENLAFRIPNKRRYKAIFIDIDGVMTHQDYSLLKDLDRILNMFSQKASIFIATARSYTSAQNKLQGKFEYFAGGIFSDGALINNKIPYYEKICDLTPKSQELITAKFPEDCFSDRHYHKDYYLSKGSTHLLRVQVPTKEGKTLHFPNVQPQFFNSKCYFKHKDASKLKGILELMQVNGFHSEDVLFISDNPQDTEVFQHLPYTVSPPTAKRLSKYSAYTLSLAQVPMIIK